VKDLAAWEAQACSDATALEVSQGVPDLNDLELQIDRVADYHCVRIASECDVADTSGEQALSSTGAGHGSRPEQHSWCQIQALNYCASSGFGDDVSIRESDASITAAQL
jgi:hypothetical protein